MAEVGDLLMEGSAVGAVATPPPGFLPLCGDFRFNPAQVDEALSNIRHNLAQGVPTLEAEGEKDGSCVIVGGSPSINRMVDRIRGFDRPGNRILAMNDAVLWLARHGIQAHGCVVREIASEGGAGLLKTPPACRYYIASNAHPGWLDGLRGQDCVLWHSPSLIGDVELIHELDPDGLMITGGVSAALRSIGIGRAMGYRNFHLFGVDSSLGEGMHGSATHAYEDRPNETNGCREIWVNGRNFQATDYWIQQSLGLIEQVADYERLGFDVNVSVHGDGLLPWLARQHGIPVFN